MPENSSMRNPITQFPLISTLRYFNYYNIQPTLASVITPFSNAHSNLPQASAAIVLNAPQKKAKGADRRPGAINKVGILVIWSQQHQPHHLPRAQSHPSGARLRHPQIRRHPVGQGVRCGGKREDYLRRLYRHHEEKIRRARPHRGDPEGLQTVRWGGQGQNFNARPKTGGKVTRGGPQGRITLGNDRGIRCGWRWPKYPISLT